jgi:hypothetical protein
MDWVSCQNANRANVPASHRLVIGWNSWHDKRFRLWHFGILASWLMANLPKFWHFGILAVGVMYYFVNVLLINY